MSLPPAIIEALAPVAMSVVTAVVAALGRYLARYIARLSYAADVEAIRVRCLAVAADLQGSVDTLKDPRRDGVWNDALAATMRANAVKTVRDLEPLACAGVLAALGGNAAALDALIGTHVEEAVRALRRVDPHQAHVARSERSTQPPPPPPDR